MPSRHLQCRVHCKVILQKTSSSPTPTGNGTDTLKHEQKFANLKETVET